MRSPTILLMSLFLLAGLAGCLSGTDEPVEEAPPEALDIPQDEGAEDADAMQMFDSFEQRAPGVEREMRFLYPFPLPPGQDLNRVTLDLKVNGGFLVAVSPTLFYADTGETPSNQEMHIHHAHWFRTSNDPEDEYYTANLAWVFGTGEERTSGSFHDRADVDPDGPRYGMYLQPDAPQVLIYMIHNKLSVPAAMYVALDVRFVYGSAEEIAAAADCPDLQKGEMCRAGEDFHHLNGKLWGTTFDVPREPIADGHDGEYIHPIDIDQAWESRRDSDDLGRFYTAAHDGTAIASAGHLHPNGKEVIVANLGPEGSGCEADLDGDGLPGITILRSEKIEQVPEAFPHSEEYQMGATKHGWRAPVREGDRITQFALYDNDEFASYAAMSFVGFYVDRQQVPEDRDGGICTVENTGAYLLDGDASGGDATEGTWNRAWSYEAPPHCGAEIGFNPCDLELAEALPAGMDAAEVGHVIHVADFLYVPGDQSLSGEQGAPVRIQRGDAVTFVNEDAFAGIRHTITSCKWPCNGPYVANYPQPDGDFHSGKLGNLDPIDGGGANVDPDDPLGMELASDTLPIWELDTSDLEPGYYAYYCLIHPWMRGWIEVV